MADYPMPGQTDFSADEEQQMRQPLPDTAPAERETLPNVTLERQPLPNVTPERARLPNATPQRSSLSDLAN